MSLELVKYNLLLVATVSDLNVCICAFQISATDDICIVKDGTCRKLVVKICKEEDSGKYRYEADGRKTEAVLTVEGTERGVHLRHYVKTIPFSAV